MRILLVGGRRWRLAADRGREERTEALRRELNAAGHDVVLLPAPPRRVAPFRRVGATLGESRFEHDVATSVRRHEPHVALVCGLGAGTSVRLPWLLAALGIPCAVEVELGAVACHRGDLRYQGHEACAVLDDPARCAACCMVAATGGLARASAFAARRLAWLRTSSPFPNEAVLRGRRDEVLAAFDDASLVLVRSEAEREGLVAYGVEPRRVRVLAAVSAAELAPLLATIARSAR